MLEIVKNGIKCVKSTDPDKNILGNEFILIKYIFLKNLIILKIFKRQ